jgi:NADPH2:quinone reductase
LLPQGRRSGESATKERRGATQHDALMIALQYAAFGEPADTIAACEVPKPEPGPNEVRLRLLRSPIHNHDLATIRGIYGVKPALPAIGGSEMLGTVDALGPGVSGVKEGQRVAAGVRGAWAQYVVTAASSLVPVPDAISDDVGAQLLAMPFSAVVLFESMQMAPGEWLVQNAANGAVGRTLETLARQAGVNVMNLVRRQEAADELRARGAEHVVVTDEGWPQRVRSIVGSGHVVRVVDSVCDAQSAALNRLLVPGGEHVVFGALAGRALTLDPGALIFGQTRVRGFWMIAWMAQASPAQGAAAIGRVIQMALAGQLQLPVGGVYSLDEPAQALVRAETPGRNGKVLFTAID